MKKVLVLRHSLKPTGNRASYNGLDVDGVYGAINRHKKLVETYPGYKLLSGGASEWPRAQFTMNIVVTGDADKSADVNILKSYNPNLKADFESIMDAFKAVKGDVTNIFRSWKVEREHPGTIQTWVSGIAKAVQEAFQKAPADENTITVIVTHSPNVELFYANLVGLGIFHARSLQAKEMQGILITEKEDLTYDLEIEFESEGWRKRAVSQSNLQRLVDGLSN